MWVGGQGHTQAAFSPGNEHALSTEEEFVRAPEQM
jgi:hypothetical protein